MIFGVSFRLIWLRLLPACELAAAIDQPEALAHKMTYCLRKMGTLDVVGKRRNAWLYALEE